MKVLGMRCAKIQVSSDLMRDVLAMPDGSVIYGASWNPYIRAVELFVTSPDLPLVKEGEVPEITPIFTADYDKKPSTWLEFDWNLD